MTASRPLGYGDKFMKLVKLFFFLSLFLIESVSHALTIDKISIDKTEKNIDIQVRYMGCTQDQFSFELGLCSNFYCGATLQPNKYDVSKCKDNQLQSKIIKLSIAEHGLSDEYYLGRKLRVRSLIDNSWSEGMLPKSAPTVSCLEKVFWPLTSDYLKKGASQPETRFGQHTSSITSHFLGSKALVEISHTDSHGETFTNEVYLKLSRCTGKIERVKSL